METSFFKGVEATRSGSITRETWIPLNVILDSEGERLPIDKDDSDGLRFGRSGLDTLIVILAGLGETDLNHTVLLGITFCST